MQRVVVILIIVFSFHLLTGCADAAAIEKCVSGEPQGFWWGLLHGFISLFTFIISLFREDVAIYAVNNTGGWYDFGFILGVSFFFGGSSRVK